LVTLSAAYGAGGSVVGPRLAQRLGLPFVDRAIPVAVAQLLRIPAEEATTHEQLPQGTFSRWIAHFSPAVQMFAGAPVTGEAGQPTDDAFRLATEAVLRRYAATGGVILGRAAAVVLSDVSNALHVRLDGPRARRIELAARRQGLDEVSAAREQQLADLARETYVRHWYNVDPRDPALYHLVIDSTVLAPGACVELLAGALELRQ
jgi:cytidylate kinase